MKLLEEENRELRERVCRYERAERDGRESEAPVDLRLWTTRAAVAVVTAPYSATASGTASTVVAAYPGSPFHGNAMPELGAVSTTCGTAFGAARGAPASFNTISRPAVFA